MRPTEHARRLGLGRGKWYALADLYAPDTTVIFDSPGGKEMFDVQMGTGQQPEEVWSTEKALRNFVLFLPTNRAATELRLLLALPKNQAKRFTRALEDLELPLRSVRP